MRYATVKNASKPMVGFYFSKKSHRKTIEAPKRKKEENAVEVERKRKKAAAAAWFSHKFK